MQPSLAEKDTLAIVVTDSGLGGLGIAAELFERLRASCAFKRLKVIFFNCLPSNSLGYDSMKSDDHRIRVLANALDYIARDYAPDAILLACNTISVIYDKTAFVHRPLIPVISIIQAGIDEISGFLGLQPCARVILFSSLTTAQTGVHKFILSDKGFASERISYQVCHGLIAAIERGPTNDETRSMIDRYVSSALNNLPSGSFSVAAAMLCTHFSYSSKIFYDSFILRGIRLAALIDPNRRMIHEFLKNLKYNRFPETLAEIEVVSQADIPVDRISAIASAIFPVSTRAAAALRSAACVPGLFSTE
jgi:glutamate racemase